jgi:hypothetical protein
MHHARCPCWKRGEMCLNICLLIGEWLVAGPWGMLQTLQCLLVCSSLMMVKQWECCNMATFWGWRFHWDESGQSCSLLDGCWILEQMCAHGWQVVLQMWLSFSEIRVKFYNEILLFIFTYIYICIYSLHLYIRIDKFLTNTSESTK